MFEDSLFISRKAGLSARTRVTALAAIGIQATVVGAILIVPLLRPERLALGTAAPQRVSLAPPKIPAKTEPPKPKPVKLASGPALWTPTPVTVETRVRGGSLTRIHAASGVDDAPPLLPDGLGMGSVLALGSGRSSGTDSGIRVIASGAPGHGPVRVSSGVSNGMLLFAIRPVYPRIAVATHVHGTVVVTATIDRTGRIIGLRVVSGPEMLRKAALDAVGEARYKPFLLNGEPTEVETTVAVNFTMDG